ncbi:MAG: hypothetical protein WD072_08415 [Pirellulales bacterium]
MSRRGSDATVAARIDGERATITAALDRAAGLLESARRVLVVGLADATLEAIAAACDIAEVIGGGIDTGAADTASPLGPVAVRAGAVTADFEELRDRADLVILWFCDADAAQPARMAFKSFRSFMSFMAEFVTPPLPSDAARTVLAVGPEPLAAARGSLVLPPRAAIDAARLLHALLLGHEVPPDNTASAAVADACRELVAAIRAAGCVAVVTCRDGDPLGLSAWAVSLLVRAIAHERPAFALPLAASVVGTLDNAAGAAAVLTWRYGAAGGIARADRYGGAFRPAECSGAALIARGEVDAVLAVGGLPAEVEEAIASRTADLALVRIDDHDDTPPGSAGPCVHLRCGPPAGTVLRADGREMNVCVSAEAGSPDSMVAILNGIYTRLSTGAVS